MRLFIRDTLNATIELLRLEHVQAWETKEIIPDLVIMNPTMLSNGWRPIL